MIRATADIPSLHWFIFLSVHATCSGENLDFPYRDIFLHYRYLYEPSQRPVFTDTLKPYQPLPQPFGKK